MELYQSKSKPDQTRYEELLSVGGLETILRNALSSTSFAESRINGVGDSEGTQACYCTPPNLGRIIGCHDGNSPVNNMQQFSTVNTKMSCWRCGSQVPRPIASAYGEVTP